MNRGLVALLVVLACACRGPAPTVEVPTPRPSLTPEPALPAGALRPAYTATQIAHSHPVGTFTEYRLVQANGPDIVQRTEWVAADPERCRMRATAVADDGTELPAMESAAEWWELRNHGALPAAETTVTDVWLDVPAGRFECWLYTQVQESDDARRVARMWFDKRSAGSPVQMTQAVDGVEVVRMVLLDTNRTPLVGG